jgi:hypothetical protein
LVSSSARSSAILKAKKLERARSLKYRPNRMFVITLSKRLYVSCQSTALSALNHPPASFWGAKFSAAQVTRAIADTKANPSLLIDSFFQ